MDQIPECNKCKIIFKNISYLTMGPEWECPQCFERWFERDDYLHQLAPIPGNNQGIYQVINERRK